MDGNKLVNVEEPGSDAMLDDSVWEQIAQANDQTETLLAEEDEVLAAQPPQDPEPLPTDDGGPTGEPEPPVDPATSDT